MINNHKCYINEILKYVHETNCMLISNCVAYFSVPFYYNITVSYPAVLVLHLQELKYKTIVC